MRVERPKKKAPPLECVAPKGTGPDWEGGFAGPAAVYQAGHESGFLPTEHWAAVKATIEAMPVTTERGRLHASRCRWLFSLLYIGGLRVSELCGTAMGGFFSRRGSDGRERWWLEVIGKGSKTRLVPATSELMAG